MTKRMLIDASHAEETRVVVLDGNRLEDYDVETAVKKHLKGNIYLAKVVRVEPSLQAAFVEFGGNRHGFLPFGEIHPDYYQIPKADRERLIAMAEEEARAEQDDEDDEEEAEPARGSSAAGAFTDEGGRRAASGQGEAAPDERHVGAAGDSDRDEAAVLTEGADAASASQRAEPSAGEADEEAAVVGDDRGPAETRTEHAEGSWDADRPATQALAATGERIEGDAIEEASEGDAEEGANSAADSERGTSSALDVPAEDAPPPETIGGESEAAEEARERRPVPRFMRNYKIQEVIRRRQILLIQVVKEERKTKDGYKGASLTTYISLAGRFCVLMPNSPRGGGISRKITSAADRRRLKEITTELDIPRGMGLIVRTAGAARPKPEIKRDCEYLLRLWDDIRDTTMASVAPALIYEEASLIKRAIRDVYSRDVEEILVDGEEAWRAARDFMRMLMPAHARKVQLWRDGGQPLFARQMVEAQLDQMLSPTVQLRSGGYLVIDQTEALVAIDVNSGRSTRERGIEETALRTNLEAAEEVARQLRLRDLAGIIVIDFIDMESKRNNAMVERRIKDALKNDRARIQVGQISHFGLLEMSRQRLRPSLAETSFVACPHCGGSGHVRSTDSAALHVLRAIEEEGSRRRAAEILVSVANSIALYILNNKRDRLSEIEERYEMKVGFSVDDTLQPPQLRIDRLRPALPPSERPVPATAERPAAGQRHIPIAAEEPEADFAEPAEEDDVELTEGAADEEERPVPGETAEEGERRRRRRRRRRRPGGRRDESQAGPAELDQDQGQPIVDGPGPGGAAAAQADEAAAPRLADDHDAPVAMTAPALAGADPDGGGPEGLGTEGAGPESGAAVSGTEEGEEAARRRRGRRGGRRRRRDEEVGAATGPETNPVSGTRPIGQKTAPPPPPVYVGPTPADPFAAGAFDLFDVLDEAEQREAALYERGTQTPPERAGIARLEDHGPSSVAPEPAPAPEIHASEIPVPEIPAPAIPAPAIPAPAIPAPQLPASALATTEADADAAGATPVRLSDAPGGEPDAAEAGAGPLIKPVIVGSEPVAEKRRGWWRR